MITNLILHWKWGFEGTVIFAGGPLWSPSEGLGGGGRGEGGKALALVGLGGEW